MSSKYVRDQIKSFLTANAATENQVDLSAQFLQLEALLNQKGLSPSDPFLGLQWLPSGEQPLAISSSNAGGCFRELGVFIMHVVEPTDQLDVEVPILDRAETLLSLFRGATINNDIIIESVTQANFDTAATLNFEKGYQAAAVTVNFYYDYKF
jgi:hypothetical protein